MPAGVFNAGFNNAGGLPVGAVIDGVAILGTGAAVVAVQVVDTPPKETTAVYPVEVELPVVPRI
jgi:hypothetical protein